MNQYRYIPIVMNFMLFCYIIIGHPSTIVIVVAGNIKPVIFPLNKRAGFSKQQSSKHFRGRRSGFTEWYPRLRANEIHHSKMRRKIPIGYENFQYYFTDAAALCGPAVILCFLHDPDRAHNNQQDKQLHTGVLRENRCILCIYPEQ